MKYVPNPAFMKLFEASDAWFDSRDEAAREITDTARAIAPVDKGTYRDSISAEDGKVVATAAHAASLEFGTKDTPTFAPLRRAAIQEFGTDALRRR